MQYNMFKQIHTLPNAHETRTNHEENSSVNNENTLQHMSKVL